MNSSRKTLQQILKALRAGERLSDEQVLKLADLRRAENVGKRYVAVNKVDLREGEEIWDFIDAIWTATFTNRVLLADGSLDVWLYGIYDEYVIVQDGNTGRLFKSFYSRDEKGVFSFTEPVEVMHAFVEVEGEDGDVEKRVAKRAPETPVVPEYVEVAKRRESQGTWAGVLPSSLSRR